MWGYKLRDQNYKDTKTLIRYLVRAAGMGANLLLNVGPQPNGELPATALSRMKEMGQWLRENGETIYATEAGPFPEQSWGTATRKGNKIFLHVLSPDTNAILLPGGVKIKSAKEFLSGRKLKTSQAEGHTVISLGDFHDTIDYIIECEI